MVTYKEAGVDIDAGTELIERLKKSCPDLGGFGGLFPLGDQYLVAGTDGVGTKLKIAFELNRHDTIGIDLVAMCVNDIITSGAKPLFFLDYFATSRLDVDQAEQVLNGIIRGCKEAECILLGGETAEMPGFYHSNEYDISGFAVGIVPKDEIIDGRNIQIGDKLVGIRSSGLHSNGFSLIRKIFDEFDDELLIPTRIYVRAVQEIRAKFQIKGIAHITGGGLTENVPRMLKDCGAMIRKESWEVPQVFRKIQEKGKVSEQEMMRTFNMGIGMVLAMDPDEAFFLCQERTDCSLIGEIIEGKEVIWS